MLLKNKLQDHLFLMFIISCFSAIFQIFFLKQLFVTYNAFHSPTIIINILITLTIGSIGLGAFLSKSFQKIKTLTFLYFLLISTLLINIFILKFRFPVINLLSTIILFIIL